MSQTLTSRAIKGVQWTTSSTIITSVLQIGYTSVMSRLLDPSAFGLIAIAQIILNFGSYFARMGLSQALIQKKELSKDDVRVVFTSGMILSSFFGILMWFLAPYSNLVFDKISDEVVPIIRTMALTFFISGFNTTSVSLLTRELKFKQLAIQEVLSFVLAYLGIGITMGFLGFGVWSLVFAHVGQVFFLTVISYIAARHSILPIFKWSYYKPFFKYGSVLSVTTFIEFLSMNLPLILIGRFFGDYKLGIYRQAFMIINLPLTKLSFSIQKVVFPMYSMIQSDLNKIKKAYLSSITLMAAILLPIGFGMSVAAKEITLVLLGEDFIESYPILSILSLGICFKFLSQFAGIVWNALASLRTKFFIQVVYLISLVIFSFYFKDYGLLGFAWIVTIGEIVRNFVFMVVTGRMLNVSLSEHLRAYLPGLVIGIAGSASIFGVSLLMDQIHAFLLLKLLVQMTVGGLVLIYLIIVHPLPGLRVLIREYLQKISFFSNGKGKVLLSYLTWYKA